MIDSEIIEYSLPPEWSERWWEANAFVASVNAYKENVPAVDQFVRPELKPLREAWVAARFATICSQDRPGSIKLEASPFPDFHLCVGDEDQSFEICEADRKERKRGDEYRETFKRRTAGQRPELRHFDPSKQAKAAIPAIIRALEIKAGKGYRPAPHLLVYVNFWRDEEPPLEISQAVQSAEKLCDAFASVWLLWGDSIIRLWPRPAMIRDQRRGRA